MGVLHAHPRVGVGAHDDALLKQDQVLVGACGKVIVAEVEVQQVKVIRKVLPSGALVGGQVLVAGLLAPVGVHHVHQREGPLAQVELQQVGDPVGQG